MNHLTCHEVLDFLSEYLDGALPATTIAAFEDHLAICDDCRAYLDNFRATLRATKAAYAARVASEVPDELVQAILASRRQA